jgi:hypothetical protein
MRLPSRDFEVRTVNPERGAWHRGRGSASVPCVWHSPDLSPAVIMPRQGNDVVTVRFADGRIVGAPLRLADAAWQADLRKYQAGRRMLGLDRAAAETQLKAILYAPGAPGGNVVKASAKPAPIRSISGSAVCDESPRSPSTKSADRPGYASEEAEGTAVGASVRRSQAITRTNSCTSN